ncbi:MAG TPA: thioesterase family protein [Caulobacter sp.]|nr:thioesterase family protein [Caulobacter sp.]
MANTPESWPEIWRGGVNTWECDEMGHMNVRFYVAKAVEGLATLAALIGLPEAFCKNAASTLLVREQHIRFHREAHAGAALHMVGGVAEVGESEARLVQLLIHSTTGEVCASFQTVVVHATAGEGAAFPWSDRTRRSAEALVVEIPEQARARSLDLSPVETVAGPAVADELQLMRIGLGAIAPQDCDAFGRMRPELFIGRVSDGIGRLVGPLRAAVAEHAPSRPARTGGAVLEYRLVQLAWPRAGERFELRSGLVGADARTMRLVHWMLEPGTGKVWGTSEAVAITFDLDARKVVPIAPPAQAALRAQAKPGLAL